MKAWRLHAYGDHRLDEIPVPEVKPGWVLVKVKVVQVAVVEAGNIEGMQHVHQSRRSKMLEAGIPIQLGHEFSGEVVGIGEGVTNLKLGDKVGYPGALPCGECNMCLTGRGYDCISPLSLGVDIPGALAEYITFPAAGLAKMPDHLTHQEIATLQPLSDGVSMVKTTDISLGDTVVVLGQGAMGLGILQIAKLAGAGMLVAVDIRPEALKLSEDFGANVIINSSETDPIQKVMEITGNYGADVIFDMAGGRPKDGLSGFQTAEQAIKMAKTGGKIILGASLEGTMELNPVTMRTKCIKCIFPPHGDVKTIEYAAFLVASGRMSVRPQISHVLQGLEQVPEALNITMKKAEYKATNAPQIVV